MKAMWTRELTEKFCLEADALMLALKEFRARWNSEAKNHQSPKGEDASNICDKEADLSDCLDRFVDGSG